MTGDAVLKIIEKAEAKGWQKLNLSNRGLTEIPKEIYNLKTLTRLNLSQNKISEIPGAIANLTNLTELYLNKNQISEIPDAIANLTNLTKFDLSGNQISKIPDAIANLTNLTKFDLSNNQISEIPDAIAELKNLTELGLFKNQISEIPATIAKLKNLTGLGLSYNQISEIPEFIIQMKNLEILNLKNNPIQKYPGEVVKRGIYAIRHHILLQELSYYQNISSLQIERSIEFPPEYWTAGNSILSYFSHILSIKYPDQNIKVKIEQEGLLLRMIIDTPEGKTETIEQTFNDYILVISRQLPPENLLTDPFEIMALKTKLQIAEMELRITRENFAAFKDDSRQRINSLEMQVSQLFSIIGQSLQKDHHITVNLNQELYNQQRTGDDINGDKVGNDKIGRDKIEGE
jgi:Leucine-rich repeat (LRR) protein